ncbi:MAG: CDP-alcohol phosphatidyltransferase family protein [Candidatus Magasanikbacteria bacterium]
MKLTANKITGGRLFVFTPLLLVLHQIGASGTTEVLWACLAIMIVNELLDAVDGKFARSKNGVVTTFGKLFDPWVDSLSRGLLFLSFVGVGWIPWWLFGILFVRDICVAYTRTFAASKGIILQARGSGKIKGLLQAISIPLVTLLHAMKMEGAALDAHTIGTVVVAVIAFWTFIAGADYLRFGVREGVFHEPSEPKEK